MTARQCAMASGDPRRRSDRRAGCAYHGRDPVTLARTFNYHGAGGMRVTVGHAPLRRQAATASRDNV